MIQRITKYFSEVGQEVSKVSWPSREELYGSIGVVVVICLLLSVFVFGIDQVLSRMLHIIF